MSTIICMGVSGVGKSSVGQALADQLGGRFLDADDLHPAANRRKMEQGIPLDDADRAGWLAALHREISAYHGQRRAGEAAQAPLVVACSALKERYRVQLCAGLSDIIFVYLKAPFEVVKARLAGRRGHFMPLSLLESQFAALEGPSSDAALIVDARLPIDLIVEHIMGALRGAAK